MNALKYKDCVVQRGFTYHYYYSPAAPGKPTLFFVHGFPSTSFDWSRQVAFFEPKGYGLLVPDCLGYGGTSKPTHHEAYRWKLLVQDLVDVLDAEHLDTVVGIGHDWGSALLSALMHHHEERFRGFAWIALSYLAPVTTEFVVDQAIAAFKEKTGSDGIGYWKFFAQPDAPELSLKHIDSFVQLAYAQTPEHWLEGLCPVGGVRAWLEADRQPGRAEWLTEEEYNVIRAALIQGGLEGPVNYYRVALANGNLSDHQTLPEKSWHVKKPALFIATTRDYVCLAAQGKLTMQKYAPHADVIEVPTGHWAQFEAAAQVNDALEKWVAKLAEA